MAYVAKSITCVKGEIHNLLAIMRFMPKFCPHPELYMQEVKDLFESLIVCTSISSCDCYTPFLRLIKADDVCAPITGVALSSIHKFLLYGFVDSGAQINKIVKGVVKCAFPLQYTNADEVVIMKLLHVFLECLRSPVSPYVTDKNLWSMIEKCVSIYERDRVTELLKRTTQNTLM
jgi:hypothetical protein